MENYTVLCVDDESCILSLLTRMFRKEPYELFLAKSGEEAIEILKEREIALIISDYKMPGMSGLDFLREARKISPQSKSILMSAFVDHEFLKGAAQKLGVFRCFHKPWENSTFLSAIKEALEEYKNTEQGS